MEIEHIRSEKSFAEKMVGNTIEILLLAIISSLVIGFFISTMDPNGRLDIVYIVIFILLSSLLAIPFAIIIVKTTRRDIQKKEDIEWDLAMKYIQNMDETMKERLAQILLKEVKASFTEEERNAMDDAMLEEKTKIKARFIEKVYNELFVVREKEESESWLKDRRYVKDIIYLFLKTLLRFFPYI